MQTRPKEVIDWGHQRELIPSITNVEEYHQRWIAWWGSCQPKWRSIETWPYARDDAKSKDWARLNVTGPHGLFAIVVSASWWAGSMESDHLRTALSATIDDLRWVIENLIYFNAQSQATKPASLRNRLCGRSERQKAAPLSQSASRW